MNDTVTKILALADEYANTKQAAAWAEKEPRMMKPGEIKQMWLDASNIRQALQDELTKLFTPLTDEQIEDACESLGFGVLSWTAVARAVEKAHGIGESK